MLRRLFSTLKKPSPPMSSIVWNGTTGGDTIRSKDLLPHEQAEAQEKELNEERWWRDQLASGEKWDSTRFDIENDKWFEE